MLCSGSRVCGQLSPLGEPVLGSEGRRREAGTRVLCSVSRVCGRLSPLGELVLVSNGAISEIVVLNRGAMGLGEAVLGGGAMGLGEAVLGGETASRRTVDVGDRMRSGGTNGKWRVAKSWEGPVRIPNAASAGNDHFPGLGDCHYASFQRRSLPSGLFFCCKASIVG